MAWRIDELVIRGEIDNREKGRVVGRLWLIGREEPVELDLKGNCWRDLAGRKLKFTNPEPKGSGPEGLAVKQKGTVGDISASRKVKVPDIPMEEIGEYYAAKKPFPWHWGNSLYLEWFSQSNGRVVIESAGYELEIVGEAAWEMTEEEEEEQRAANGQSMGGFMDELVDASEDVDFEESIEDDTPPPEEEEADLMLHRNDILTDRIRVRMEREGEGADFEEIMKSEIERLSGGESRLVAEWTDEFLGTNLEEEFDEEAELECYEHELSERAQNLTNQLLGSNREKKWIPEDAMTDHPAAYLLESVTKAGGKLANALDCREWPPRLDECGLVIALLKRARVYMDDAITALESCQEQKLIEPSIMGVVFVDLIDIAKDADTIIDELRARLKAGF